MPTYEYECEPCRIVYQIRHAMNDAPLTACPKCSGAVTRLISMPHLVLDRFSSPTEAKYARMTPAEEIAREKELQKDFRTIFLPDGVKG